MKILLVAINAKYIHSNLAVYSLKAYAEKYGDQVELFEYTINHRADVILQEIYKRKPDVVCFSCYIWNIDLVKQLAGAFHALRPEVPLWAGGPEVSYEWERFLLEHPEITGLMLGEGEGTFRELCEHYVDHARALEEIKGIAYRNPAGQVAATPGREPLSLDEIPFCYGDLSDFTNRIIYYETSRGCPFRCSYCLSSVEKGLRFKSLPRVFEELGFFLEKQVPQVKFVDRTFNCDHEHARAVWQFLKDHDNGITNFHFEISADLLTGEELELLGSLRPGLVQLEIGVQTVNPRTIREIRRTMDLERLKAAAVRIRERRNIHVHLDLIAGLPFEDYRSFQKSFDEIYALHPQQLQLGFLKVLKGSFLYENRQAYGLVCQETPPYEVLKTRWLSYDELIRIKQVEEMLEVYYNSGQFEMTMQILELAFASPFEMFLTLGRFYEARGWFYQKHSRIRRCEILLEFVKERGLPCRELYEEALTFDLYYRENMKSRPSWAPDPALFKDEARRLGQDHKNCHLEPFYYDFSLLLEKKQRGYPARRAEWRFYRFSYGERDPLTGQAKAALI